MKKNLGWLAAIFALHVSALHAEIYHYEGVLTIEAVSGKGCGKVPLGMARKIDLIVEQSPGASRVTGIFKGEKIAPGKIAGDTPANLAVEYAFADENLARGHSLFLKNLGGETLEGELHEKHLDERVDNCNFDRAGIVAQRKAMGDDARSMLKEALDAHADFLEENQARKRDPDGVGKLAKLLREARQAESAGNWEKAAALRESALPLQESLFGTEGKRVATALHGLAESYYQLGRYAKALPLLQRALAIREKRLGADHADTTGSLNNLALLFKTMGRYKEAETLYRRALQADEKNRGGEHPDVATDLNNLAELLQITGRYGEAEPLYRRALAIFEKRYGPDHDYLASNLNNLAWLFRATGRHAEAETLYRRSLAIFEKNLGAEHPNVARNLNNLAGLLSEAGRTGEAEPLYRRALAIDEAKLGVEHPNVASDLNNLAELLRARGNNREAETLYRRALAIHESLHGPDHLLVGAVLNNLAGLNEAMGRNLEAEPLYLRAYRIAARAGAPELLWNVQDNLRNFYTLTHKKALAVFYGKQAVNTLQGVRGNLKSLDQDVQKSFLARNESTYQSLADLLIAEGRIPEAQEVLTMLKEQEYYDFVRRSATDDPRTTQSSLTGQEQAWQERYRQISGSLAAIGAELDEIKKKAKQGLSEAEKSRRSQLDADAKVARQAFDHYLADMMRELGKQDAQRNREVGEKNLASLKALQGTLGKLGHGAVTLHYLVTDSKVRILLTTPQIQLAREADISATALNRKIAQLRGQLQSPRHDPRPLAQELYRYLIEPVDEDLKQAKAQTLMLSLDGALRYLPIAALYDGERYLAERYALAIFTEAAKDKLKDMPTAQWSILGLGLTRAVKGFEPLPSVKEELNGIVSQGILEGEVYFDQEFTAERFKEGLDQSRPLLHIASHFVFKPGTEADSYLLLGDGEPLSLREIRDSDYDFRNVDLITLSACETAVGGGKDANGREIEGFGVLAQKQGAKGVLATLWPVADASTGPFMQNLYRIRQHNPGMTKAEALRQAQLAFIKGGQAAPDANAERGAKRAGAEPVATYPTDPSRPYAHPYYWAPFILMGNWL
ncbi:MAG: tetratricopeptide repeat protein [Sulfuricellaceae bacterium]